MGLLKAGIGAAGGVLADQWREYFYCDSLTSDTLMVKGQKRSGGGGSDNIISDGSIIAVNEGQCMIIVQQGEIIEVCADPGEFVFEGSTEPSIFYGDLGEGIKASFERIGRRFTFAGSTANDQRVYFFNTKEIMGNKWGTPAPVPFRVVDANIGLDMDITVRANGEFSYRIIDPLLFYKNVCANVQGAFTRDKIDSQLKSEFLKGLQAGLGNLSALGIRYSAIPAHTIELADSMNTVLANNWAERGLAIASVGVNSITTSPEDEERIKEWQSTAVLRDPNMRAAYGAQKQGTALVDAANNDAGAMMWRHAGCGRLRSGQPQLHPQQRLRRADARRPGRRVDLPRLRAYGQHRQLLRRLRSSQAGSRGKLGVPRLRHHQHRQVLRQLRQAQAPGIRQLDLPRLRHHQYRQVLRQLRQAQALACYRSNELTKS